MKAPTKSYMCCASGVVGLLITGLLLFFLMQPETTTTTIQQTNPAPAAGGECKFWGDPHIVTFDGARPSFYGNGEFWVVKGADIWVQGRYLGTDWTHGLAATNKLVVGGPFLQGHKITVGTLDDDELTVDGASVLPTLGSHYSIPGVAYLSYSATGELVDEAQSENPKHIVHMDLPLDVTIEVMRWDNYMDFRIVMPKGQAIDGSCGNFNGDPTDDTTEAIIERMGGARVAPEDMLFEHVAPDTLSQEMKDMLEAECTGELRERARSECAHLDYPPACEFDVCFGMNAHARKEALTYSD